MLGGSSSGSFWKSRFVNKQVFMLSWSLGLIAAFCLQCGLRANVRIQGQWHVHPLPTKDPNSSLFPMSYSLLLTSHPFSLPLAYPGRLSAGARGRKPQQEEGRVLAKCRRCSVLNLHGSFLNPTLVLWGGRYHYPCFTATGAHNVSWLAQAN